MVSVISKRVLYMCDRRLAKVVLGMKFAARSSFFFVMAYLVGSRASAKRAEHHWQSDSLRVVVADLYMT